MGAYEWTLVQVNFLGDLTIAVLLRNLIDMRRNHSNKTPVAY